MNSINITGRLVDNPTHESTGGGTDVCKCRIAVDGAGQGRGENLEPGFFDVVSYGKSAKAAADNLTKGSLVGVSGNLRHSTWKTENDEPRSRVEIVGQIEFLQIKKADDESTPEAGDEN